MINNVLTAIYEVYLDIAPFLLIGLTFAGILHIFIGTELITRYLGKRGLWSSVKAALLGVPLPLCSCGVIPTAFQLKKSGASSGATLSFLISTPQTGADNIIPTYAMLGPIFAIFKPIYALFSGIIGGIVTDLLKVEDGIALSTSTCSSSSCSCKTKKEEVPKKQTVKTQFKEFFHYAFVEFLDDLAPQLFVGIVLAAFISLIPSSLFIYVEGNYLLQVLMIVLLGLPLYVCDTSSLPIALVLFTKGLLPGAIFVFLVVGPATNIATISLISKSMGRKITSIYLSVIALTSIVGGLIINYLYDVLNYPYPQSFTESSLKEETSPFLLYLTGIFSIFFFLSITKYLKRKITNK